MIEYNYDMLMSDLSRGIEREFKYKDMRFGILLWEEGWSFSYIKEDGRHYESNFYKDVFELLKVIRIEGKTLKEIFDEEEKGADILQTDFP